MVASTNWRRRGDPLNLIRVMPAKGLDIILCTTTPDLRMPTSHGRSIMDTIVTTDSSEL